MSSRQGHWVKSIACRGADIVRLSCLPAGDARPTATCAVREPSTFRIVHAKASSASDDWEKWASRDMAIQWRQDGNRFSRANLQIDWIGPDGKPRAWRPGRFDKENLGGPFFALDFLRDGCIAQGVHSYDPMAGFNACRSTPWDLVEGVRTALKEEFGEIDEEWLMEDLARLIADAPPTHLPAWNAECLRALKRTRKHPPGLLSRSGATIVRDDSLPWNPVENWIATDALTDESQVLYIIRYGSDYKRGLGLLAKLFGAVPKLPDWALGVWYSCYRKMGDRHFREIAEAFQKHDLPLDAVVVDTDWHQELWHGFDWNKRLFPDPKGFAGWLKKSGLFASFNVHPQYIPAADSRLPQFLKQSGTERDIHDIARAPHPLHKNCQKVDLFDRRQTEEYFDLFHAPIEREGCAMWWVDGSLDDPNGRDATDWMNELYATRGRPSSGHDGVKTPPGWKGVDSSVVLSRGHGLGAHRSVIHFTADAYSQWNVLKQEVEATSLGSNALMGHVSHDIGGFIKGCADWKQNKPPDELMTRWVQFGCLSPIMRLHSDHGIREPWRFRRGAFVVMQRFLKLRRALQPLLLDLADEAHRSGVGMCRPMYYEFPDEPDAYRHHGQYMLGENILVAPVVKPGGDSLAWIPKGEWRHAFGRHIISGPVLRNEKVSLDSMPIYVRQNNNSDKTLSVFNDIFGN